MGHGPPVLRIPRAVPAASRGDHGVARGMVSGGAGGAPRQRRTAVRPRSGRRYRVGRGGRHPAPPGRPRRRRGSLRQGRGARFARPFAGLALLRLAQGRVEAADRVITAALEDNADNRLGRAWLLPAQVEIAVAAGDLVRASRSAEELR